MTPTPPTNALQTEAEHTPVAPSRRRGVVLTSLLALLLLTTIAPFDGMLWHVSSNFRAQAIVVSIAIACWSLVRRRWLRSACLAVVAGLVFAVSSVPRAPRMWHTPTSDLMPVRVLHFNIYSYNTRLDDILTLLDASNADVISLMETPKALTERFRAEPALAERWPHRFIPPERWAGLPLILSRWPLESDTTLTMLPERVLGDRTPGVIVSAPNGQFLFSQAHPMSPKTPNAVIDGDTILSVQSERFLAAQEALALPLIVAADLNGAQMSRRGHMLHRDARLRPTKASFDPGGTWPSWLPASLRIGLDDIWVSDGVYVQRRQRLPATGSDHIPVLVELLIPSGAEVIANPPGDQPPD